MAPKKEELERFNPQRTDAVTHFLPRLISGKPMKHVHRVNIYDYEPRDLAAAYAPVPKAGRSDDRFFFTPCKRQNGSAIRSVRGAGAGKWTIQKTVHIKDDAGVKVGEKKSLYFKKDDEPTGWLMEEYRCCLEEAVVDGDVEMVLCRIYLSPNASAETRQESAAYLRPRQEHTSMRSQKRPAAVAADQHCPKRARGASGHSPPVAEADEDIDQFTCAMDELLDCFGARKEEETQRVLDEILGRTEPEQQAVWTIEQESSIAAEEEKCSWALLGRYKQLHVYQEFISYTFNLEGCGSDVEFFTPNSL